MKKLVKYLYDKNLKNNKLRVVVKPKNNKSTVCK